ncbi:ORF6N domain-containing protein [Rummeliibacillus pycnus]|uniref:ORF6N domain-containing protein n=1 Tax=Rummeliibacillus pycnus TaxID=101070 RepID=UPI0037CB2EBB
MNHLQAIEQNNQRVLTTVQLAEAFETTSDKISYNFKYNESRYKEGKHFFLLTGEDLKDLKVTNREFQGSVSRLYLWTEKGAWLHAKSINSDKAWDAYESLVDDYYEIKEEKVIPLSKDQALVTVLRTTADLIEDTQSIKQEQHKIRRELSKINEKVEEQITLDYGEQRRLQKAVACKVYEIEDHIANRSKLFREIYREIKDRFAVASYKDVKRQDLQIAIQYIENYVPRRVS